MAATLFFAGFAAARFGRKPVMVASLVVSALATLAAALAPNWGALLALRGLMGLALAGLPSLAMAYLAEEIDAPALGFAMGMYIAGSTLGGMFGRLVVGFIADHGGWRLALGVIGANSLLGAAFFAAALPGQRLSRAARPDFASQWAFVRDHFADEGLPWLFAVGYLVMGAFICTYNYIGFRLAAPPFSLDQTRIGLIFTLYLLGAASSTIMGELAARLGRRRVLWIALAIGLVGVLVTLPDRSGHGGARRRFGDLELFRRAFDRFELGRLAGERGQGAGVGALFVLLLRRLQPQRLDGRRSPISAGAGTASPR